MKRIEYDKNQIIDLTNYDFSNAPIYKSKPISYQAFQVERDETIVRSWGIQEMKKGDWIILKPSSNGQLKKSGVKKEAFQATYKADPQNKGNFIKEAFIKAIKIDYPFQFIGIDSDTPEQAPAGTYLVLNLNRHGQAIIVNDRRDIFFYTVQDLMKNYELA
jgi:hypothetical protein